MAVLEQRVGRGEQEQRPVPEPHQVAHEGLLVGEDEPAEHDLEFRDHHQQRQPVEAQRAPGQRGNDDGGEDQRPVQHRRAVGVEVELPGQIGADIVREQPLDAQEADDAIGQPDQQHRPERRADDEVGDPRHPVRIIAQRHVRTALDVEHRQGDRDHEDQHLNDGQRADLARQQRQRPRPIHPVCQPVVDQIGEGRGHHGPGKHSYDPSPRRRRKCVGHCRGLPSLPGPLLACAARAP